MSVLRVLSLGAGVQSTTLALMAAHGEIGPMPDCAIFADTQSEPQPVYEHLRWLMSPGVLPFPVHVITKGSLRQELLDAAAGKAKAWGRPPLFIRNADGSTGMTRRQCTQDYKLDPIYRKVRELAAIKPRSRGPKEPVVEQWVGISLDEALRMKPARFRWIRNRFPLVEQRITRTDCYAILDRFGCPRPPKSACTFCPYRDDEGWAAMKSDDPASFADAVMVDRSLRTGLHIQLRGQPYLHRSLQPLDEVEFKRRRPGERWFQDDLFINECEGMCGV